MLWLGLDFPDLALTLIERAARAAQALAIVSDDKRGAVILQCNRITRQCGVRPGMTLASALSIAPHLYYRTYNKGAEKTALKRLAAWAGQFSARVSLDPPRTLLLEVGASLRLFGGLDKLCGQIERGLDELGYPASWAVAPTPAAASLLARCGHCRQITDLNQLTETIGGLPVSALSLAPSTLDAIDELGIERLGALLRLPRAGLARRFGPEFIEQLDRLTGDLPDPRSNYSAPPTFRSRLELPAPVEDMEALLFACNRLLKELQGFLRARARVLQRFRLLLHHDNDTLTPVDIGLLQPACDAEHWLVLLREKFTGLALPAPVTALALKAQRLLAANAASTDLFDNENQENLTPLLEKLRARLGLNAVRGIATFPDHRPERAWYAPEPRHDDKSITETTMPTTRPLWLLPQPLALDFLSPRWQLRGPERIESGWWDGTDVSRDYYIALTPCGKRLWLFQERRAGHRWFVHGFFS